MLYVRLQAGQRSSGRCRRAVRMASASESQMHLPSLEPKGRLAMAQVGTRRKNGHGAHTMQDAYIRAFDRAELVSVSGLPVRAKRISPCLRIRNA